MQSKTHSAFTFSCHTLKFAAACVCLLPLATQAAVTPSDGASLAWSPNPESDVVGYHVYVGAASGSYDTIIDVVGETQAALPQVSLGTTLYLAVSAYNAAGLESPLSSELVVTVDVPKPVAAPSFTMSSAGQGKLRWKYPKNATTQADRFTVYASEDLVNWSPASEVLGSEPVSSDAEWLYFEFPYVANQPRMFFQLGASNAFGEIR